MSEQLYNDLIRTFGKFDTELFTRSKKVLNITEDFAVRTGKRLPMGYVKRRR